MIYFDRKWQELFAEYREMELDEVSFTCEYGEVLYRFCKRPIEIAGESYPYIDIVTPCEYTGPYLSPTEDTEECRQALAVAFNQYFQKYCEEKKIIAEYVQYNPELGFYKYFDSLYELESRTIDTAIDLTVPDIMKEELNARRRRSVRSAIKQGVEIHYDYEGKMIDEFLRIYQYTIEKHSLSEYFQYEKEFLSKMFEELEGNICIAYATHENRCVSACILVYDGGKYMHYQYAANDTSLNKLNASSLLIYTIACDAQKKGYKWLVLGGAGPQLLEFKKSFNENGLFECFAGKKIRNKEVYDRLTEMTGTKDSYYFPQYRDNGKLLYYHAHTKEEYEKEMGK